MSAPEGPPDQALVPEATVTLAVGDLDATLQRMVSAAIERAMAGLQFAPRGPILTQSHIEENPGPSNQLEGAPEQACPACPADAFPAQQDQSKGFPLPEHFRQLIDKEWQAPAKHRDTQRPSTRHYELTPDEMKRLKLPVVDAPVAALGSACVLPTDFDGMPKDVVDRRIEVAIHKTFDAAAGSLRASAVGSLFARASYLWTRDLLKNFEIPEEARREINKISTAAAFVADATTDVLQLSARAMAGSVAARRNTWLRQWDMDATSQAKVVGIPFKGDKLFGEDLVPLLVETKGKKQALPTRERSIKPQPKQTSKFFRGNRSQTSSSSSSPQSNPSSFRGHGRTWQRKPGFKSRSHTQPQFPAKGPKSHSA
ncbi:hypothetical protein lerEdw1_019773 [Lerista edwardsae]|nr:hypothetical protein lerEdw1_019773 [Lerista edwardsae]